MNLINFLGVIVLVTNCVYCFVPRRDYESPTAPKVLQFPIQQQTAQTNDISVYDPGVDKSKNPSSPVLFPHIPTGTNSQLPPDRLNIALDDDDSEPSNLLQNAFTDSNSLDLNQILENLRNEIQSEENIAEKSAMLLRLLEESSSKSPLPIVYVEDDVEPANDDDYLMSKRSGRYYRRYPWKRQNTRSRTRYEAESRYLCVPSREDVFKLLIGLHENRNGNHHKTVHFCNRKRPAKAIFTNIRFLG